VASGQPRKTAEASGESAQDEIDGLFQRPLDEFTAARNALATTLKKRGLASAAEQVKGLAKPPVSAWVVNQLYWEDRKAFDRMLALGEQSRVAQAAQLAGKHTDTRTVLAARREALATLTHRASQMLRDAGHAGSLDTLRRITATLEALATYGRSPDAPKPGRLTADLDPPGFEALAALMTQPGMRTGKEATGKRVAPLSEPKPAQAKREAKDDARAERARRAARETELRKALQAAERALKDAERDAGAARAELKALASRAAAMEKRRAAVEAQLERAKADAQNARAEADQAGTRAEQAAQVLDDAEAALQRARKAIEEP
jgi:hypothetical protein